MNKNFKHTLKEILLIILFLFLSLITAQIGSYVLPQYEYQLSFVITAFILLAAYKILKLIFKSLYLIHSKKIFIFFFWGVMIALTGIGALFVAYCVLFVLTLLIITLIKNIKESRELANYNIKEYIKDNPSCHRNNKIYCNLCNSNHIHIRRIGVFMNTINEHVCVQCGNRLYCSLI